MMVVNLKPKKGGFLRAFRCGEFIRDFLQGKCPYGSTTVNPRIGAPQAEIFREYKLALMRDKALDKATKLEEKKARRENRLINPDIIAELADEYLTKMPYKAQGCRFHSFVVYFSMLQKLGWVKPTGIEEPSAIQDHYPKAQPRKYFRLTKAGRRASDADWANPHRALYGQG